MYVLTLTADERRAFDWVGSRYNSGKVAYLLTIACRKTESGATTPTSRSRFPSMSLGKSTSLPRRRITLGHALHRRWLPSSMTYAGNRLSRLVPAPGLRRGHLSRSLTSPSD